MTLQPFVGGRRRMRNINNTRNTIRLRLRYAFMILFLNASEDSEGKDSEAEVNTSALLSWPPLR